MIIWGSYVMRKVVKKGDFHCPHCQERRAYTMRKPRRWGHLYWIPLIPMEEHESYVECDACKNAYREVVLEHDPIRDRRQLEDGVSTMIAQAVGLMAHSRGQQPSPEQIAAIVKSVAGLEPSSETMQAAAMYGDREAALRSIAERAGMLTALGKEEALAAVIAGAPLTQEQRVLAADIGASLGMTPAHVQGVLAAAG